MKTLRIFVFGLLAIAADLSIGQGADRFLLAAEPQAEGYPNSWTVFENIGYESAYDEIFHNPAWVAYCLDQANAHTPSPRPSIGYPTDNRTVTKLAAAEYPSGYDHGHMASNNCIASFFTEAAQDETFLMSNMVPQRHSLNAGPWKTVETDEVKWAATNGKIWVICGPIYTTGPNQDVAPKKRLGPNKNVCVPVFCFKIVMAQKPNGKIGALAFIMPQEGASGHKPKDFLVSVREIEERTGLNFFANMSAADQDEIEEPVASDIWKLK